MTTTVDPNKVPENVQNILSIGARAAAAWIGGTVQAEGGDALAIFALCEAQRVMTFTAQINRGTQKEPEFELVNFDVLDLRPDRRPMNEDGTKDNKRTAAMREAVMQRVFGISYEDAKQSAVRGRFDRAILIACYLCARYAALDDEHFILGGVDGEGKAIDPMVSLRERVKVQQAGKEKQQICLRVVHEAVAPEPKPLSDGGDENDVAQYESDRFIRRVLNGKRGYSLREVANRANAFFDPNKGRGAGANERNTPEQRAMALRSSIQYVTQVMRALLNPETPEGEAHAVALNKELRLELFILTNVAADYFSADPLEEDEEKELERRLHPADNAKTEEKKAA